MEQNNFHYGQVLLDMLYGIDMEDEEYEELGLRAWQLIGNKNIKLYKYCTEIDCTDNSITLPCNAVIDGGEVEAVTASFEDWQTTSNKSNVGDLKSAYVEHVNEYFKFHNSAFYMPGKLLKYHQVGEKLYFDRNYGKVHVLYKGVLFDDEGLPQITDNEANAIATYIAYVTKFKEGLITNNGQIIQLANVLKANWLQQCDQARVTYLNQNDMNNILEVKSSWGRYVFGKSFKPIP